MKTLIPIILIFLCSPAWAYFQIDSLEQVLANAQGSEKVSVLNEIYKHYINSEPEKALEYTKQAFDIAIEIDDKKGLASSYNNLGVFYRNHGVLDKAMDLYLKSMDLYGEIADLDGVATVNNNIGTVYSLREDFERALEYFNESYRILDSLGDKQNLVGSLSNIGNVYSAWSQDQVAIEYYNRALEIFEDLGVKNNLFDPLTNIGNIYFRQGKYDEAMSFYQRSLETEKINENQYGQAYALTNIAVVYSEQDRHEDAINLHNQALKLAMHLGAAPIMEIIYKSLSEAYDKTGDLKEAYNYLILYDNMRNLLTNQATGRRIAQLEMAYEMEKKDQEIILLQKENAIISLRAENSRIFVVIVVMSLIILMGAVFIIYTIKRSTRKQSPN